MAVVTVLNRVFAGALKDGELDYLQDRSVRIRVHGELLFRPQRAEGIGHGNEIASENY